ncbi:MAG: putative metal-binding motif-containing protein [Polyangiales bacterium]
MYARCLVAPLILGSLVGCGARTALRVDDPPEDAAVEAPPECTKDDDCGGDLCAPIKCERNKCVKKPEVVCDDKDPCTQDACDLGSGTCVFKALTLDVDGDGHKGPAPGHKAGDPGSCGDDCDDTNKDAFPGNKEICDGVDNDCNGIVDDNMVYVPPTGSDSAIRISKDGSAPAEPEGLAYADGNYMAGYSAAVAGKPRVFTARLDPDGKKLSEDQITKVTADAFEGRVVWNGAAFGLAWSDRRSGSWEVYFNRTNAKGEKLQPDLAVSDLDDAWSLNSAMAWTGTEFVLVWQDQKDLFPESNLYGRRVDVDGKLVGDTVQLIAGESGAPQIAIGKGTVGITWDVLRGRTHEVWAGVWSRELKPVVPAFRISTDAVAGIYPRIAWNGDDYVVAFHDQDSAKKAIYAITFDEAGKVGIPLKQITDSVRSSRFPWLLPLGDRLLVVFSDSKDMNSGYELYTKMLDKTLAPLGPERRVTNAPGDSVSPIASFGPTGDVGVIFRDDRTMEVHTYFTRLVCRASGM